jgi:glycosyltransferase involved in cell wall biosynthesis
MHVFIAGTRGIPAAHGGFETFAEDLAVDLVGKGHQVTVFCQSPQGEPRRVERWNGIELVHLSGGEGALGTIIFDLKSAWEGSSSRDGVVLTLGYNTAVFSIFHRLRGTMHIMNMDGIEWKRDKWRWPQKAWLRLNEFAGAKLANHLIADHPSIRDHLKQLVSESKISVIPYGALRIDNVDPSLVTSLSLEPDHYALLIARPEPDNSILEIVRAFSAHPRTLKLVILGAYRESRAYDRSVLEAASKDVLFLGPIYDKIRVQNLRKHAHIYVHGHKVGGTNPSLVESLSAGNAVVAHDNVFNRWVAGNGALYFSNETELSGIFDRLTEDDETVIKLRDASWARFQEAFELNPLLNRYETLLANSISRRSAEPVAADLQLEAKLIQNSAALGQPPLRLNRLPISKPFLSQETAPDCSAIPSQAPNSKE